jgi:hypothetical protein
MKIMLNHSSATERKETPYINKSTKNKTLNLNGSATECKEAPHANKGTKNKTLNFKGTSKKTVIRPSRNKTLDLDGLSKKTTSKSTKNEMLSLNGTAKTTISSAVKRRAQSVIKDRSIDAQSRALIRYGLETNDPWLAELVRRANAGETILYTVNSLKHPHPAKRIQTKKRLKP